MADDINPPVHDDTREGGDAIGCGGTCLSAQHSEGEGKRRLRVPEQFWLCSEF